MFWWLDLFWTAFMFAASRVQLLGLARRPYSDHVLPFFQITLSMLIGSDKVLEFDLSGLIFFPFSFNQNPIDRNKTSLGSLWKGLLLQFQKYSSSHTAAVQQQISKTIYFYDWSQSLISSDTWKLFYVYDTVLCESFSFLTFWQQYFENSYRNLEGG